jgi:hypothetical protein
MLETLVVNIALRNKLYLHVIINKTFIIRKDLWIHSANVNP